MVALSLVALEAFLIEDDDTRVVMLNLLRFQPDGGRMATPVLVRFGAKILFGGDGLSLLTLDQQNEWDAVVLVQYPRRSAFRNMVNDSEYQLAFEVGKSAIADIALQPIKPLDELV